MLEFLKKIFAKGSCPECGWFFPCQECEERFDNIDEELRKKENRQFTNGIQHSIVVKQFNKFFYN